MIDSCGVTYVIPIYITGEVARNMIFALLLLFPQFYSIYIERLSSLLGLLIFERWCKSGNFIDIAKILGGFHITFRCYDKYHTVYYYDILIIWTDYIVGSNFSTSELPCYLSQTTANSNRLDGENQVLRFFNQDNPRFPRPVLLQPVMEN